MKWLRFAVLAVLSFAALLVSSTARAGVQDFSFSSYEADYYLSRDTESRSVLQVREKLVAQFPEYDQNHGIERAIPMTYDGHSVNLRIASVTKPGGAPWNYTIYNTYNNLVLRIGDANTYVRGEQTYIIDYTVRDVTKAFENGDELYWDTNGTEWSQPFYTNTTRIHIAQELTPYLSGQSICFSGAAGSTSQNCTIDTQNVSGETVITTTATTPLQPGENVSVVVGFQPGTFAAYKSPPLTIWQIVLFFVVIPIGYILLPILLLVWAIRQWRRHGRDKVRRSTVVPQYLPPKGVSTIRSDIMLHTRMTPKAIAATIVDLAVRHYLKIYQVDKTDYELELVKAPTELTADDRTVVNLLFGTEQVIGSRIALKDKTKLYTQVDDIGKAAYTAAIADGLMIDTRAEQKRMQWVGGSAVVLGIFTLNIGLLCMGIVTLVFASNMPARSQSGVELHTYLDGTKMYMQVAEADRLRALQAPDTATKIDISDKSQLVKLYERLLPLAMLYGIEKQWARQFASLYTAESGPDWFAGNSNTFNAVVFAGALASFGSNVTLNTFSAPTNSSGSGFSSGGGFSGGGGGGGGGGGW